MLQNCGLQTKDKSVLHIFPINSKKASITLELQKQCNHVMKNIN